MSLELFDTVVDSVKEQCKLDHPNDDKMRVMISSTALKTSISTKLLPSREITSPRVLTEIGKVLQSNDEMHLDRSFTEIVSERMSATSVTVQRQPATLTPEQQLVAYMSEPVIPVRSDDGRVNSQDLLDYWYHYKDEWPALTRHALSYLSCPPSSVTSERVFSRTGSIVSKKRCALLHGNIGRLAFIKFNYKKF